MNFHEIDYSGWTQVALAVLALLVAPATISTVLLRKFYGFRAECMPIRPNMAGSAKIWKLLIKNKSRLFGGFIIIVYPTRPGNFVVSFRFLSPNDGGLVADPLISDGALEIRLKRFAKKRQLAFEVNFQDPDFPNLESDNKLTVRKTLKPAQVFTEEFVLGVMYQRMMLVMLLFVGVTFIIVMRMILGVSFHG